MWIKADGSESTPPVDVSLRLRLDVVHNPVKAQRRPCGEDSENSCTFSSAKKPVEGPIHILENPFFGVHIWGAGSLQN